MAFSEPEKGVSVRLSDWLIDSAQEIRQGELTFEMPSGEGYVSDLQAQARPAPVPLRFLQLVPIRQGTFASESGTAESLPGGGLRWSQTGSGFAGAYSQFTPCDAQGLELCLWVRGQGEVELGMADPDWLSRQDSLRIERRKLTSDWRLWRVIVPGPPFRSEAFTSFSVLGLGQGEIHWAGACLSQPGQAVGPPPAERTDASARLGGASWVWDTQQRLEQDPAPWIQFLQEHQVKVVFLQQPETLGPPLEVLISRLHEAGFSVLALNGDRHDILPEARPAVLKRLASLQEFQERVAPAGRFDGLHFDVEPYLLPGFAARRVTRLREYLSLVEELVQRGHAMGLKVGFDLPFWFDGQTVEVAGVDQSVTRHVLQRADEMAIMSYRTEADLVWQCAARSLTWAGELGKPVWLSLETVPLPDEKSFRFEGKPHSGSPQTGEVVYSEGQFWLGPSTRSGLCWSVKPGPVSSGDRISFARLPWSQFVKTLESLRTRAPVAIHDLTHWMSYSQSARPSNRH